MGFVIKQNHSRFTGLLISAQQPHASRWGKIQKSRVNWRKCLFYKGNSMQRSGTEAIRTQIQPSKPKRKITKITNSQNTKRAYGQPNEQLFPKSWLLSNPNPTKNNMNTFKMKRHLTPRTTKNYRLGSVSNELLGGLN